MQSTTTTLLLAALAFTNAVSAQFSGQVFMTDEDTCPSGLQSETSFVWTNTNGAQCLTNPYSSNAWSAYLNGALLGTTNIAPTRFGSCPTSDCGSDCNVVDITQDDDGVIHVDCFQTDDGPYIYIGY